MAARAPHRGAAAALIVWCAFPSSILPFALSVVIYRQSTSGVAVTLPFAARAHGPRLDGGLDYGVSRRRALALWRDDDAVEMIGLSIEFERGADVKSKVRCRLLQDFAGRNGYPRAIDLHLIVAIDLSS
jgi:hypothetical protein